MSNQNILNTVKNVLQNMPSDWLRLTTHRLDIYKEELAKTDFLDKFEKADPSKAEELDGLPTAFDYIRLGHPLSCVLEWAIAKSKGVGVDSVVAFSSQTMPIMAVLRKNLMTGAATRIVYKDELPKCFDVELVKKVYGYNFELVQLEDAQDLEKFNGNTVLLSDFNQLWSEDPKSNVDFVVYVHPELGSVIQVNNDEQGHIKEIQHVRRRESIAMTPHDCLAVLELFAGISESKKPSASKKDELVRTINKITHTSGTASIGSCGLSVQYAIMMGLVHHSMDHHPGKDVKFIVPPNCYGGTNDQARRVAACLENVEILDLPVDGGKDMVEELEKVLEIVAQEDAIPFIIAEIPTNPRVEVPDLEKLRKTLVKQRKTKAGNDSVAPVFILDQTFCPNVKFLGEGDYLYDVQTISYVSGSKFPSGGLATAGYCVANDRAQALMGHIQNHLELCANEATDYQVGVLAEQMPSMNERIAGAYKNTREFVDFIEQTLPEAKINFVPRELADQGFTPSVFSLDLPTKGSTPEEREAHKRDLNLKLITMMIQNIPEDSKHCVSYGQLKGCYWTIPATSTQGTTKEGDKDYIVRVSMSPELDMEKHKQVFAQFCERYIGN